YYSVLSFFRSLLIPEFVSRDGEIHFHYEIHLSRFNRQPQARYLHLKHDQVFHSGEGHVQAVI
nr:hypothetical protein [Tanacetum cinerariifolium]